MKKVFFGVIVTLFLLLPTVVLAQTATINDVALEHNAFMSGQKGVKAHVDFSVDDCGGEKIWVCLFVFDSDYEPVPASSRQYSAPDGQLTVQVPTIPPYESSENHDFILFLPYNQLHYVGSSADFNLKVCIIKEGDELDYTWASFSLNRY